MDITDERRLIKLVERCRELYDTANDYYGDSERRLKKWEEIANALNQPADRCRSRWQNLRNSYRRNMRKFNTVPAKRMRYWKFQKEMAFIIPYMEGYDDRGLDEKYDESQFISVIKEENQSESEEEQIITSDLDFELSEIIEPEQRQSATSELEFQDIPVKIAQAFTQPETSNVSAPTKKRESSPSNNNPPIKKKKKLSPTATDAILDYLKEKDANKTNRPSPIYSFFMSMADTVNTFPSNYQAIAKKKVFECISEIELQLTSTEQV